MNTLYTEEELVKIILDLSILIHKDLGPGLLESVYEEILCMELLVKGITIERQKTIPLFWKGKKLKSNYRADLIVGKK